MNKIFEREEKPRGMIQMFLMDGKYIYSYPNYFMI